jgi:hypothetical protein
LITKTKILHSKALTDRTHKELSPQKAHCSLLFIYQGQIHKIMQNPENKLKKLPAAPETRVKARNLPKFSPTPLSGR